MVWPRKTTCEMKVSQHQLSAICACCASSNLVWRLTTDEKGVACTRFASGRSRILLSGVVPCSGDRLDSPCDLVMAGLGERHARQKRTDALVVSPQARVGLPCVAHTRRTARVLALLPVLTIGLAHGHLDRATGRLEPSKSLEGHICNTYAGMGMRSHSHALSYGWWSERGGLHAARHGRRRMGKYVVSTRFGWVAALGSMRMMGL
jgi:hypothetical protein